MTKAALTIALLTPAWPGTSTPNGIVTSVVHMAAGLREIGHVPVILGRPDGPPPEDIAFVPLAEPHWTLTDKIRARLTGGAKINSKLRIAAIVAAVRTAHARYGLDVLIMEESLGWPYHVIPAVPVPVVIYLHGPWALMTEARGQGESGADRARITLEARAFARAAGIIAPSEAAAAVTDDIAHIKQAIIPNACPVAESGPSEARRTDHILYVGRVERLKGVDTLLGAFELLGQTHPETRLTFVGPDRGLLLEDGRTVGMDEAIATLAPGMRARIDYLGPRPPGDIAALRQTHGIALMASRFETLSYTMLEALAAGQAMVSTRVGGPAEVLEDGVTGRLVPPGDAGAMAAALAELIGDPSEQARLAEAGRAMLGTRFAPARIADETVGFLRTVLAERA
ncbi:MAG: glycosyltransferase family 4 protein [Pseudomonadota bacterium]